MEELFLTWYQSIGSPGRDTTCARFSDGIKNADPVTCNLKKNNINTKYIHSFFSQRKHKAIIENKKQDLIKSIDELKTNIVIKTVSAPKSLLELLKKENSVIDLSKVINKSERVILAEIEDLKDQGYNISLINNKYFLDTNIQPEENIHHVEWDGDLKFKFGIVSDTHLCNKHQQITFLKEFYHTCEQQKIKKVYHVGDITDGYYSNRAEQIYELFKHGVDEQAEYVIKNYPNNIPTDFIIGNHDTTHIKNGGANIGKRIQLERPDMKYLGSLQATINITPNCKMELRHPLDGTSYSLSYKPQKYVESITGGEKPNILLIGHYHKLGYFMCRNIHTLLVPSMEAQTAFMKGKNLASEVGGIILTIYVDKEGTVKRFMPEFIPCYKHLKNDY